MNTDAQNKRLMILGASILQLPAIQKAKEMGLEVAVVDKNRNAIGVPFADIFFEISTIDSEGIYQAAKSFKANGIMTLATDMPMRALSYACDKLGLPGLSCEAALKSTDKIEMIKAFEEKGVAHPFYYVWKKGEGFGIIDNIESYPIITKPSDNSGSRGIMLAYNRGELLTAIKYSSKNGRSGDVIIEEFMRGPEFSVELMVINGIPQVLQITEKLTTGSPHFVEIGHSQPSQLSTYDKTQIGLLASKAAMAVGIENGSGHAEIILTKDGPKMVEIGARMGGDYITTHLVPLSTGIDMTKAAIQLSLNEKPDISSKYSGGAAIRFFVPPKGRVKEISGIKEARSIPGVIEVIVQCEIGQELGELESSVSRIGYVIAKADTAQNAIKVCEHAISKIQILVE